ncbi:MAG: 3,4-dioxygenase subunit beta [Actinomycetota bacterium]
MTTSKARTYEGRPLAHPDEEIVDQGLAFDVETLLGRRRMLKLLGVSAFGAALVACGASSGDGASGTIAPTGAASSSGSTDSSSTAAIPEETAGPYPADGSNGPDVLSQSGIVRSDIRSSFGGFEGTAAGVPLSIEFRLETTGADPAPIADAAVYAWHCDRDGLYSLYTLPDQNYLRGVQSSDADGIVTFSSVFPACYSGRWPHIHFEVYPDLDSAAAGASRLATSQIALPKAICDQVYATAGYEQSVTNLQQVSLQTDNVFGDDGGVRELGTVTGSIADGLAVALSVPLTT